MALAFSQVTRVASVKGILNENPTVYDILSRVVDPILLIVTTISLGYVSEFKPVELFKMLAIYGAILTALIFPFFDVYRSLRARSLYEEIRLISVSWLFVVIFYNVMTLLLANREEFRLLWPFGLFKVNIFIVWALLVPAVLSSYRFLLRTFFRYVANQGHTLKRIVIVGAGKLGQRVCKAFTDNTWLGCEVVGFFDDDVSLHDTKIAGVPVVGTPEYLALFLNANRIDEVFIAIPFRYSDRVMDIAHMLRDTTADIYMIPDYFNFYLLNLSLTEVAGLPVINLNAHNISGYSVIVKWLEDKVLSALILLLISPILLGISLAVKLSSPGPIIFRQRRFGFNGEEIIVYKFRSMTVCEDGDTVKGALRCDPRVTPLGAFMRRTSLDELPQFINVLQGRMSIVGPRPYPISMSQEFRKKVSCYQHRHKVKPGITGWAQINGWRGTTDTQEKLEKRVEFDLYYIRNWSIWFDLKIILLTIVRCFIDRNAY